MPDVVLVYMPFGQLTMPSLALEQINAQLCGAGMRSQCRYLNVDLAEMMGIQHYMNVSSQLATDFQFGEYLMSDTDNLDEDVFEQYHSSYFKQVTSLPTTPLDFAKLRRDTIPAFMDHALDTLLGKKSPKIVAFTLMFFQTAGAIRLARSIKDRSPDTLIVVGGPCAHDRMGLELISNTDCVDVVATGETDGVVCQLFQLLLNGEEPAGLPGILYRDQFGQVVTTHFDCAPTEPEQLDQLPYPDYTPYLDRMHATGWLQQYPMVAKTLMLPFETSRGCWWGAKVHCKFCGLNALHMNYRSRSPATTIRLVEHLHATWPNFGLFAVDNILPHSYYKQVLPALADLNDGSLSMFYEIKSNLTRKQVRELVQSGIRMVQPGIESFSTDLLKIMGKGVSGIQNLFALRLFTEYGIIPSWLVLFRFPGEQPEHYVQNARALEEIYHLPPSEGLMAPVEMHRFSPYFKQSEVYAQKVAPKPWYKEIFGETTYNYDELGYYFDANWLDVGSFESHYSVAWHAFVRWVELWRDSPQAPRFEWETTEAGKCIEVVDSRSGVETIHHLRGFKMRVFQSLTDLMSMPQLLAQFQDEDVETELIEQTVDDLVAKGLCFQEDRKYVTLALPAGLLLERDLASRQMIYQRLRERLDKVNWA